MVTYIHKQRQHPIYRVLSGFIALTFIFSVVAPPPQAFAQAAPTTILNLPVPGTMVSVSNGFMPPLIKSITVHPEDPFKFNFLVDTGDSNLNKQEVEQEAHKLIKYFYAALTTPEGDMWVNLSPYEKDRIIQKDFGDTEMGRDLLAQDYILKQLTASLMYPEDKTGKKFWDRVYKQAQKLYGTTEIPTDTFHKVWIVPETAVIYEKDASAYVVESHLKVMMEDDYEALRAEKGVAEESSISGSSNTISTDLIKEVLLPEIEKEVNEGENFSQLRQVYNSVILASWYKDNLKESLLGQMYVDQGKTRGVDVDDKEITQKIYNQYIEAFKEGVYDYIREDYDPTTQEVIPRKYFSGGATMMALGATREDITAGSPGSGSAGRKASQANSPVSRLFDVASSAVQFTPEHAQAAELRTAASPIAASSPITSFEEAVKTLRDPIVGFNFKSENIDVEKWLYDAAQAYRDDPANNQKPVRLIPDHTDLEKASETIDRLVNSGAVPEGHFILGAQNVNVQDEDGVDVSRDGAFTSHPPSIERLKRLKVKFVLVGHSEITTTERGEETYVEPDVLVGRKAKMVVDAGLGLIIAFGETIQQKRDGQTEEVLASQLSIRTGLLSEDDEYDVAYEPVWAIGTDRFADATEEDAESNSRNTRQWFFDHKSPEVAARIRILFGGSVSGDRAPGYNVLANVDGGLIGSKSKTWATAAPIQYGFAHPNLTLEETGLVNESAARIAIDREKQTPATLNAAANTITTQSRTEAGQQVTVNIRPLVAVEKERIRQVMGDKVYLTTIRVITMTNDSIDHAVFLQSVVDPESGETLFAIHETLLRADISSDQELESIFAFGASSPIEAPASGVSAALERAKRLKKTLAYNKDAQRAYTEAIEKESQPTRNAFIDVLLNAVGVSEPMATSVNILVDSTSSNFPKSPFIQLNPDGTRSEQVAGQQPANLYLPETAPDQLTGIYPTDGLPPGVAIQHVVVVLPKAVDPKLLKGKILRDFFRDAGLDLTDKFKGTSDIVLPDGIDGLISQATFNVRNVDLGEGIEGSIVEAHIGYTREARVKTYETEVPAEAIEGLPFTTRGTHEVPDANIPSFPGAKARNFAIHGAGGAVARSEIFAHMLLVAAGKVDPTKVKIPFLTNINAEYLERILNRDGEFGGILDLSPGKDKFVLLDPDPTYPEIQRVYVQFRGYDFFFNLRPGHVKDLRRDLGPLYDHFGIDVVLDGTDYQTEAKMREHLTANVQGAINLSIGKKDAEGNLPDMQFIVGTNDFKTRFHFATQPGGILYEPLHFKTSCTGNCLLATLDAIQNEGGLSGRMMRQWNNDVLVSVGLKEPSETATDRLQIAAFSAWTLHAITQNRPLDSTQGHGTNLGALIKPSGGAKAAMYLEGVDPRDGSVSAARLLTIDGSITPSTLIVVNKSGYATEEVIRDRLDEAQHGTKKGQLTVERVDNTLTIKGRKPTAIVDEQSIRSKGLTDHAIFVKLDVGYPNVTGFSMNVISGAYQLLSEMTFPQAPTVEGLLKRLERSGQVQVTGSAASGYHYYVIDGQEALLRQPGEMLEYLRHEVRMNANDAVKKEAARAIYDIAQKLGTYATTGDYLDRQSLGGNSQQQRALDDTLVGATFHQGSFSGGSRHASEAIANEVVATGALPVIDTGWDPRTLSNRSTPLHPYRSVGKERSLPGEEVYEPHYLAEVQAEHLASLAMAGYTGPVVFRHTVQMDPAAFKSSEGEYGEVEVAIGVATERAKEEIRIAAESNHYNIGVNLTGVVKRGKNQALINLIREKLKRFVKIPVFNEMAANTLTELFMGSRYEDSFYDAHIKADEVGYLKEHVASEEFKELITLYEALYQEVYTVARDLTEYTRQVEKGLGFTTGPMSLQFEFDSAGTDPFDILGSLIVREKLLQAGDDREEKSIASVAKPNRVILRTTNPYLPGLLDKVTEFMYNQHRQRSGIEGLDVDFIGISAKTPSDPRSVQRAVVGELMSRFVNEPGNVRVQQFGFELYQTFMGLAHAAVVPGSIAAQKVKALGKGLKARFRGVRQADIRIIFDKMLDGYRDLEGPEAEKRVREIIAAIFTESDELPLDDLSSRQRKALTTLIDVVLLAFKEEFLDFHPDAGLAEAQEALADVYGGAGVPNSAPAAGLILDRKATQTMQQGVNPVVQNELDRRGYIDFWPKAATEVSHIKESAESREARLERRRRLRRGAASSPIVDQGVASSPISNRGLPARDAVVEIDPATGKIVDRVEQEKVRRAAAQQPARDAADDAIVPPPLDDGGLVDAKLFQIEQGIRDGTALQPVDLDRTPQEQLEAFLKVHRDRGENPEFMRNAERLLTGGLLWKVFRILRMIFFPDDQGTEHGAGQHYYPNPASANIFQQAHVAITAKLSGLAVNFGNAMQLLKLGYGKVIYVIVKINGTLASKYGPIKRDAQPAMHADVGRLEGTDAAAIGLTGNPGSTQWPHQLKEHILYSKLARAIGKNVIYWAYSRGGEVSKHKQEEFLDMALVDIAFARDDVKATMAKIKLPKDEPAKFRSSTFEQLLIDMEIPYQTQADQVALIQRFAGDMPITFSGGAKGKEGALIRSIAAISLGGRQVLGKMRGILASIVGRNVGHTPFKEAMDLEAEIAATYLAAKTVDEAENPNAIVESKESFIKYALSDRRDSPLSKVRRALKLDSLRVPEFNAQLNANGTTYVPNSQDPVREKVSRQYGIEPKAVQDSLVDMFMQGELGGSGHAAIVPFVKGQRVVSGVTMYTAPLDLLEEIQPRWQADGPKLGLELSLTRIGEEVPEDAKTSKATLDLLDQIERAKQLGVTGIVLRMDITDDNYNSMAYQLIEVNKKARELGLAVTTIGNTTYVESNQILTKPRAIDVIQALLYDLGMAKDNAGPIAVPMARPEFQDEKDSLKYHGRDKDLFDLHNLGDIDSKEGLVRLYKFATSLGFKNFLMALGLDGESPDQILRNVAAAQVGGAHGFVLSRGEVGETNLTADHIEQLLEIVKRSTGPNIARFKTGKALLEEVAAAASPVEEGENYQDLRVQYYTLVEELKQYRARKRRGDTIREYKTIIRSLQEQIEDLKARIEGASSPVAIGEKPVGGINLNDAFLDKQVIRDGNGIPLPAYQQPILQMEFDGLLPIITNVTIVPVAQLPLIIGLAPAAGDNDSDPNTIGDYSMPADKRDRYTIDEEFDQLSFLN